MSDSSEVYFFRRPVLINGVEKESVSVRPLTMKDLRHVNRSKGNSQAVGMIARACGVAPSDVEGFRSRDFAALDGMVVDFGKDEDDEEAHVPDADDVITVELLNPIESDEGEKIERVQVTELTTGESIRLEKAAKGDSFEVVYLRVKGSTRLSATEMERLGVRDFYRIGKAVNVFFIPPEIV